MAIDKFQVDLESQIVLVRGEVPQEDVTAKIAKTGKKVRVLVRGWCPRLTPFADPRDRRCL